VRTLVHDYLAGAARAAGDRVALRVGDTALPFADIDGASDMPNTEIAPKEIEQVLYELPDVAGLAGLPDLAEQAGHSDLTLLAQMAGQGV
jgi:hypothetical protein